MHVLYRISDNGYVKPKFENATKQRCLLNLLEQWPLEEVTVFADKCVPETMDFLMDYAEVTGLRVHDISTNPNAGSSSGTWRIVRDWALDLPDEEIVYFVEDDYLHLDMSRTCLLEGVERADYVTLYDAPDKYVPASKGGNPLIGDDGADETKVILTKSHHWRLTNSTTMTFACKVHTLREDNDTWKKYTSGTHPHDFQCFLELRQYGRALISPIPTLSTHCEPAWAAPLMDWSTL
jgi:hypothetical protein